MAIYRINQMNTLRGLLLGAVLFCGALSSVTAQQQFQGFCARVKMEIAQELTFERIGFEATLEVTNNDGVDPLTEFSAELIFIDPSVDPSDPAYDASDRFFVQPPVLENINRIDGQGVIVPPKWLWCAGLSYPRPIPVAPTRAVKCSAWVVA